MREKQPSGWKVRVFTDNDARGRPTQISRTVRGSKRDAQRLAAQLEVGPGSASPAGRRVEDLLDAWIDQNIDTVAAQDPGDRSSRHTRLGRQPVRPAAMLTTRCQNAFFDLG